MQDNRKTGIGGKVLLALTMFFFYLPILYIIVFSFNGSRSLTHLEGFSLRWYEKMFADSNMMEAVVYTIRHSGGNRDVPFQKNSAQSGRSGE